MIEIHHLRKEYQRSSESEERQKADVTEKLVALENLTLDVPGGEVMGIIGPNGSGKTTLIRILATLLEPTFGDVRIGGIDALEQPERVYPLIGYMSDFFSLYDELMVWEYLDHFARCYGVPGPERGRLIDEMLELVSLEVRRDADVKSLSRGMRQRLCLAKTLLHQPKVLLLDEPASGLDPAGRVEFREIIKKLHEMGRTVLISSHILTEMTDFCTSIAILEKGRLVASGRVQEIEKQLEQKLSMAVKILGGQGQDPLLGILQSDPLIACISAKDGCVSFDFSGTREQLPGLHRRIVEAGIPILSFELREKTLEDIYMAISKHRTS